MSLHTVIRVAAGAQHTWFLTNSNTTYYTGRNPVMVTAPVQTMSAFTATQVAPGYEHTVIVTNTGASYVVGGNDWGQFGDGTTSRSKTTPVRVMGAFTVVQVAAGDDHTVFVTSTGATYATGRNEHGRLGDGTTSQ